jgi:divalent metal cation (Fe/Co/Zn/Cd) transporter
MMRNLFFAIAGAAAFGFIGYFAALVFGACLGLVVAYWRDGIFARVYYGIMVLAFSIALIFLFSSTVQNLLKGIPIDLPQIAIYGGFIAGIGTYLWAAFASFPRRQSKSVLQKPLKSGRSHTIIDRTILLLSWISIVMFFVDLVFFAPKGSFLVNFTWLSEGGLILFATALALLAVRRIFLKPRYEPKWNADKK